MAENYCEPEIVFKGWTAPVGTGIIVTGAAGGIGAATAILAAQSGLKVAAWDIFEDGIQETIRRAGKVAGKNIKSIQADLSSDDDIDRAMKETLDFCKPLYLANAAGIRKLNKKWNFQESVGNAVGMINNVCQAFEETNPRQGASIVNVAALAGIWEGGSGDSWYSSAKAAIAGYTKHRAVELKGKIRMNCVCPGGPIHTPRNHSILTSEFVPYMMRINPMGRSGEPEEVAAAIMFYLSPASSYINGTVLPVDGGLHMAK